MQVLVTGGAGYLGGVLSAALTEAGHRVRCLDNLQFGREAVSGLLRSSGFTLVEASILDEAALRRALLGCDAVLHLAGLANDAACEADPALTREVNVRAAVRLAGWARAAGCRRFVNASSCSVYGESSETLLDEASPTRPVSLYARSKLAAEHGIDALADSGFRVVHLRQATLFGASPRMRMDLAVNAMTLSAVARGRVVVRGGGMQWRPFVHVRDAAEAFLLATQLPLPHVVRVMNLAAEAGNCRILDLARVVCEVFPETVMDVPPDTPDRRSYRVGGRRIGLELGWTPRWSIRDGIKEVAAAYRRAAACL